MLDLLLVLAFVIYALASGLRSRRRASQSLQDVVTTAAAIGVTLVTPRTSDTTLLAFYRRIRPFGLWLRTAALAGDRPESPRTALALRVRAAALTAASLLLALVGVGRRLVPPPDASTPWSVLLVLAGAALVPLWWPAATCEDLGIDRSGGGPTAEE